MSHSEACITQQGGILATEKFNHLFKKMGHFLLRVNDHGSLYLNAVVQVTFILLVNERMQVVIGSGFWSSNTLPFPDWQQATSLIFRPLCNDEILKHKALKPSKLLNNLLRDWQNSLISIF